MSACPADPLVEIGGLEFHDMTQRVGDANQRVVNGGDMGRGCIRQAVVWNRI